ncbi:AMP-binding protein [Streptomyces sp. NPDC050560]|uniref:AMP-binding protein n=1 Tax=Streptomyces sp. NPDC050560 TaxID=3365630 RepID=UPI0037A899F9
MTRTHATPHPPGTPDPLGGLMRPLPERTVPAVLARGAARRPDKAAVETETGTHTYRSLYEDARRVAAGLAALGVGAGDTVALMLGNTAEHVLTWFGASCRNAAEVPLNTSFTPTQLAYVLAHSAARVAVVDAEYLPLFAELTTAIPALETLVVCGEGAADIPGAPWRTVPFATLLSHAPAQPSPVGPGDTLGILYTSGTTGMPKGVVVSQAQTYGRMWPGGPGTPTADDRTLVVLPLYHVIGQCRGLYNTLIAGGTAVLRPKFSASRFWDTCRAQRITFAPLVGVMVSYLLARPQGADDRDHPVRHIALGTTSPELDRFRERFGVPRLSVSYGLTEAGGVLVGEAETAGCGRLRPDFDALLVDENDLPVAPGEVGELLLRSREPWGTMTGYHKMPAETAARWRNLWLHTGDLMWRRDDGTYMFSGRRSERIRVRGENVSPSEVERELAAHPAVAECTVLGVPADGADAAVGEQEVMAALVAAPGHTVDLPALVAHLERSLPPFAVPRYFRLYDRLPRTDATHRVRRSAIAAEPRTTAWDRRAPDGPRARATR